MRTALAVALMLIGCMQSFDDRTSHVDEPRVLAIVAEPAEARPGTLVRFEAKLALLAEAPAPDLEWAFCNERPAVGDPRSIAESCAESAVTPIQAHGSVVDARIPTRACATFGPEPPPGGLRPADADATGGYYQPVRVRAWSQTWVHLLRIRCQLPNAPADAARVLSESYQPNRAPELLPIELGPIAARQAFTVRAHWSSEAAESFAWLPPGGAKVQTQREWLRLRWYASAGRFHSDVTGRAANDAALYSDNSWTAPAISGPVQFWFVLSDSRGASQVLETQVLVE